MNSPRTVVIVGRPNVGKSALFNRLANKKISIVHDQPGVTRDRLVAECKRGESPFTIVDTGGIGVAADADFTEQVRVEADLGIKISDVILFVVDGRAGLTPVDESLAKQLRRANKPLVLVVNKVDHEKHFDFSNDFLKLGFDHILSISAEHGRGISDLVEKVEALLPKEIADPDAVEAKAPTRIAIVGRPNVGKSSLLNAILHDRRTLVSEIAGTTRDAVDIPYERHGENFVLIDTAGIRARGRHNSSVEVFSVMRSQTAIKRADLCVLVIDATEGITSQDKKIAALIQEAHKPCVVLLNKWDLLKDTGDRSELLETTLTEAGHELFFLEYAPRILASAKTGEKISRLFREIEQVRKNGALRIGTGPLNRLLHGALAANPPPMHRGRRFKMLYAAQVEGSFGKAIPTPTFTLFVNDPQLLLPNSQRYLEASIRKHTPFTGLPIVWEFRGREKCGAKK